MCSTYNIFVFYSNKKTTKPLGHVPDTHVVNSRYLVLNSDVQGELLGVMCYVCYITLSHSLRMRT